MPAPKEYKKVHTKPEDDYPSVKNTEVRKTQSLMSLSSASLQGILARLPEHVFGAHVLDRLPQHLHTQGCAWLLSRLPGHVHPGAWETGSVNEWYLFGFRFWFYNKITFLSHRIWHWGATLSIEGRKISTLFLKIWITWLYGLKWAPGLNFCVRVCLSSRSDLYLKRSKEKVRSLIAFTVTGLENS